MTCNYRALSLGLLTLLSQVSWAGPSAHRAIQIDGSSTIGPFVKKVVVPYAKDHEVGISVGNRGSTWGISCVHENICQIGLTTKTPTAKEREDVIVQRLGWDGLALVVSEDLAISSLTEAQVRGIFAGKITNWKEVGGPDMPIHAFQRDAARGPRDLFDHFFKVDSPLPELGTNEAIVNRFKSFVGSITYVSLGLTHMKGVNDLKPLKLNGVEANAANVLNGTYPLKRELNLLRARSTLDDVVLNDVVKDILDKRKALFPEFGFILDEK